MTDAPGRLCRLLCWLVVLFTGAVLLLQVWFLSGLLWVRFHPPEQTAFMSRELSRLQAIHPGATLQYTWVDYDRISPYLRQAALAAEDGRFMEHHGIDWDGIRVAFERNREAGSTVAGGSTISQQLARNLFLSPRRSYLRKGQEVIITLAQEVILDKRRILELYLNVVEFGEGIFGAEAAARHFFGKSAAELSPLEAADLAARLPRPRYYHEQGYTEWLLEYRAIIHARMHQVAPP